MINEKQVFEEDRTREYDYSFDSRIKRLQSTLIGRLSLINYFKKIIDKNYIPTSLKNIDVDINSEKDIVKFMLKSTNYIESELNVQVDNLVINNGSEWQKSRLKNILDRS